MSNADYRIRIKIGAQDIEVEAQGDKAFVEEIFAEVRTKGIEILPKELVRPPTEKRQAAELPKGEKPEKEKAKVPTRKVPSRKPKYLVKREAVVDKVMRDALPSDPPYRVAIQNAKDLERQCAYVLLLLQDKYEVDGLSAQELERVLVKRLNVMAKADTIAKKLKKWATHVDPVKRGVLTLFQLTPGGIDDIRHTLLADAGQLVTRPIEDLMSEE